MHIRFFYLYKRDFWGIFPRWKGTLLFIVVSPQDSLMELPDGEAAAVPKLRVTRPSLTSAESDSLVVASSDDDFNRLAKAR